MRKRGARVKVCTGPRVNGLGRTPRALCKAASQWPGDGRDPWGLLAWVPEFKGKHCRVTVWASASRGHRAQQGRCEEAGRGARR